MKAFVLRSALAALVICAGYAALFIAPTDIRQGEIYRIFFFHVSAWAATFTAFTIAFVSNVAYLSTRRSRWDDLGVSAVEVGVVCCTIGLTTGPLWAKPEWGIWWTWDPRLTTTFILWLLYISYLLLRGAIDEQGRRATLTAVFGVFAFLDVPLVYMSNRLWRTQHPQPVFFGGPNSGVDPTMAKVFILCMVAVVSVAIIALIDRYRVERLRRELEELRQEVESGSFDPSKAAQNRSHDRVDE